MSEEETLKEKLMKLKEREPVSQLEEEVERLRKENQDLRSRLGVNIDEEEILDKLKKIYNSLSFNYEKSFSIEIKNKISKINSINNRIIQKFAEYLEDQVLVADGYQKGNVEGIFLTKLIEKAKTNHIELNLVSGGEFNYFGYEMGTTTKVFINGDLGDYVAAENRNAKITVNGNIGNYGAHKMTGGFLQFNNGGEWFGNELESGLIQIKGFLGNHYLYRASGGKINFLGPWIPTKDELRTTSGHGFEV